MSKIFKKLLPAMNRVLIQKAEPITQTKSGITLYTKEKSNIGTVVAVGPGDLTQAGVRIPVSYKTGDEVLLPQFDGQTVDLSGGEYFLYRETDILGTLQK